MVEVLLKALKDKKDHAHIEKTLPVFFREWQGGFALINSATTVDDCKDCLDHPVLQIMVLPLPVMCRQSSYWDR